MNRPTRRTLEGHRTFAALWERSVRAESATVRALRRETAGAVEGRVLEIGAGVGANWPYLREDVAYVGIEPDAYMLERAQRRAKGLGREFALEAAAAEALPFDDGAFDSVLVTLTLCSVADLPRALAEMRRVLKPGGRLAFLEHVRPQGRITGPLFDGITPFWRRAAAGCHPNRRTLQAIRTAGFEVETVRHERIHGLPAIIGVARKPAGQPG